jgi:hypothetical protein
MDFVGAIMQQILFHLRPQEWWSGFGLFHPVMLATLFGIFGIGSRSGSEAFKELLKTPHDWLIFIYWGWMIYNGPGTKDAFDATWQHFMLYAVILLTLNSISRITQFMGWWAWMLLAVASLAVLSEYGFDPLGSHDITHLKDATGEAGRLVLNNSMYDNSNALGHSVAAAVPLFYYLLVWKRPVFIKEIVIPIVAVLLFCVYRTESKGAFVAGFITIVASFVFGRPKLVQIGIIILAATAGWGALTQLPRMNELERARDDEGIKWRIKAQEYGLKKAKNETTGVGYGRFMEAFEEETGTAKASHGAYNEVSAELGYGGLFIFLAILYSCVRTLVTAKTTTQEEERVRRMLFVITISYIFSAWMIDFAYRATFFFMVASVGAFHRLMLEKRDLSLLPQPDPAGPGSPATLLPGHALPVPMPAGAGGWVFQRTMPAPLAGRYGPVAPRGTLENPADAAPPKKVGVGWRRFGLIDLALVWLITREWIIFWEYVLNNL